MVISLEFGIVQYSRVKHMSTNVHDQTPDSANVCKK